jgi:hypothetical protein
LSCSRDCPVGSDLRARTAAPPDASRCCLPKSQQVWGSFQQLTAATGLADPSFYAAFGNKAALYRDRSFEQQRYRASGRNLVTVAVALWNPVYLERAANALHGNGRAVDGALLQYGVLSPNRRNLSNMPNWGLLSVNPLQNGSKSIGCRLSRNA